MSSTHFKILLAPVPSLKNVSPHQLWEELKDPGCRFGGPRLLFHARLSQLPEGKLGLEEEPYRLTSAACLQQLSRGHSK